MFIFLVEIMNAFSICSAYPVTTGTIKSVSWLYIGCCDGDEEQRNSCLGEYRYLSTDQAQT